MASGQSIIKQIEQRMVMDDILFFSEMAFVLDKGNSSGCLTWGLIPYFSLFVVETNSYLGKRAPEAFRRINRVHERIIRAARTRVKLLEDNQSDVVSLIKHLEWITECYNQWLIKKRKGLIGLIRTLIQSDTVIMYYSDHMISTSQVALFNLGLGKGDVDLSEQDWFPNGLSQLGHAVTLEIGKYLGAVANNFGLNNHFSELEKRETSTWQITEHGFRLENAKAEKYYTSIFNGSDSMRVNNCLVLLLATINFSTYVLSDLAGNHVFSWLKLRYITLYHVVNSLKKIQNYFYKTELSQISKDKFREIFENKELTNLISKSDFRNILVHYSVQQVPNTKIDKKIPLFGLVEHFYSGFSYADLSAAIDRQAKRISGILERWHGENVGAI